MGKLLEMNPMPDSFVVFKPNSYLVVGFKVKRVGDLIRKDLAHDPSGLMIDGSDLELMTDSWKNELILYGKPGRQLRDEARKKGAKFRISPKGLLLAAPGRLNIATLSELEDMGAMELPPMPPG